MPIRTADSAQLKYVLCYVNQARIQDFARRREGGILLSAIISFSIFVMPFFPFPVDLKQQNVHI